MIKNPIIAVQTIFTRTCTFHPSRKRAKMADARKPSMPFARPSAPSSSQMCHPRLWRRTNRSALPAMCHRTHYKPFMGLCVCVFLLVCVCFACVMNTSAQRSHTRNHVRVSGLYEATPNIGCVNVPHPHSGRLTRSSLLHPYSVVNSGGRTLYAHLVPS